jgi:hypothetical protein
MAYKALSKAQQAKAINLICDLEDFLDISIKKKFNKKQAKELTDEIQDFLAATDDI